MNSRIKTPLYFRILGRIKHYVDLYPYDRIFFKRLQNKELSFVQAGAHTGKSGDFISVFGEKWNGYLLEPIPHIFEELVRDYPHKQNKIFEQIALSDYDGTLKLYSIKKTEANKDWYALFTSSNPDNYYLKDAEKEIFEVPCFTLNTFLHQRGIKELDLLYMNIEGHELRILKKFDFNPMPKIIFIETRFFSFIEMKDFYEKLLSMGYRIFPKRDFCLIIQKNG